MMSKTRSSTKEKQDVAQADELKEKYAMEKLLESLLDKKLDPLNGKLEQVLNSIQFLSAQYDDLIKKVSILGGKNGILEAQNLKLKSVVDIQQTQLQQHTDLINDMEQYSRRECLESHGVPVTNEEDTNEIIMKVGNLANVSIKPEDISVSHRLGIPSNVPTGRPVRPPIIVKFVRRNVKEELLSSRKNLRNKLTTDLGISRFAGNKIYINESLAQRKTPVQALSHCQEKNELQLYLDHFGKDYMRKDSNSPAINIKCQRDIDNL